MRSAFPTDGPRSSVGRTQHKFRSMFIALNAVTSRTDGNPRPSALSDARPKDRRRSTGALNGSRAQARAYSNASSGTKTFAENVPTLRGASLRAARCRHHARIRALKQRVGLRPARSSAQLQNNFTPADVRARAEGL
jgi:hypothetical protein